MRRFMLGYKNSSYNQNAGKLDSKAKPNKNGKKSKKKGKASAGTLLEACASHTDMVSEVEDALATLEANSNDQISGAIAQIREALSKKGGQNV